MRRFLARLINRSGGPQSQTALALRPSPDIRTSFDGNGAVFLDLRRGTIFRSNLVGAAVWKGLAAGNDQWAISGQLARDYGIAVERVAQDVARFLTQLESAGFLVRHG
jgi:hypothetical protein